MKLKQSLLVVLSSLILTGCAGGGGSTSEDTSSSGDASNTSETSSSESSESSEISDDTSSTSESFYEDDEVDSEIIITISNSELDLVVGQTSSTYLTVSFPDGYSYDSDLGQWVTSNSSVVTVSQYGKVTPVAEGDAYVRYVDSNGNKSTKCLVHVYASESSIQRGWKLVSDADSIKDGDQIIFASSDLGVAASNNRKDGYLQPEECSFSYDKTILTSFGEDTAVFYVGDNGEALTLENQYGYYLAGKSTTAGNGLLFVKSKGQINWIFEKPDGYDDIYCVNCDLVDDYWLMFNKISSADIRFNLYDSNPTSLMKMPSIYRYEKLN